MAIIIRAKYKANDKGRGQIVARSNTGKQRTVNYDHALSREANFSEAAASLGNRVIPSGKLDQARRSATYDYDEKSKTHVFTFDV